MKRLFKLSTIVLLAGSMVGCASFKAALNPYEEQAEVREIVTEITDPVSGAVLLTTNYSTNVVTVLKGSWVKAIDGAKAANSTLNPTPTAPLINIGLGSLAAILALVARFKTKRAEKEAGLVNTIIAGVEMAGDAKTKASIKTLAQNLKQARELHARVKARTDPEI